MPIFTFSQNVRFGHSTKGSSRPVKRRKEEKETSTNRRNSNVSSHSFVDLSVCFNALPVFGRSAASAIKLAAPQLPWKHKVTVPSSKSDICRRLLAMQTNPSSGSSCSSSVDWLCETNLPIPRKERKQNLKRTETARKKKREREKERKRDELGDS